MAASTITPAKPARPAKKTSGITNAYLIFYNLLALATWFGVLSHIITLLVSGTPLSQIYPKIGEYTKWTQTLALLEILHIILGLVRSSLPTTVVQVASRILLVWGVCDIFSDAQRSWSYSTMLVAWSVTEVCRYSFYVVALMGGESKVLSWLRYNTFFILYPMGAGSEALCIYYALDQVKTWDIRYYYFLVAILAIYPPGLFVQYTHMMKQRRKMMKGKKKAN